MTQVPRWDLSILYPSLDSPELEKDLSMTAMQAQRFQTRNAGKISQADGKRFGQIITDYEELLAKTNKIGTYADMIFSVDQNTPAVSERCDDIAEKVENIRGKTRFFEQEVLDLSDEKIAHLKQNSKVAKYSFWLDNLRDDKKYAVSPDKETEFARLGEDSAKAVKQYRTAVNAIDFSIEGQPITASDLYAAGFSGDKAYRFKVNEAVSKGYESKIDEFTAITNLIVQNKAHQDEMRGFKEPVEARNASNQIENEVVDALVGSVRQAYPDVPHRYYALKAKWAGDEKIGYWDRNAPVAGIEARRYTFDQARDIVVNAYTEFDPEIGAIAQAFFDEKRIDAEPRVGKQGGEYAAPITDGKPFIQMNFNGTVNDVFCLAHELGHGIHYTLAQKQGELGYDAPITVNETASIFGEMLAFNYMLKHEKDPKQRFSLLSEKAGRSMLTTFRQIAMHGYELDVHSGVREKGELKTAELNAIWTKNQTEMMGLAVINDKQSETAWAQVPHLLETPFYVYAYAFGECLTSSLYQVYENKTVPNFQEKYKEMLSKGGTENYKDLLKPMGLDASKSDFWQQGIKAMKSNVDQLETLTKTLGMDKTKPNAIQMQALKSKGR